MGFNNGYNSGYDDAKAEFAAEKARLEESITGLQERVAELEAGGGESTAPAGATILEVAPSAIVPSEDQEETGTSTIDLSELAVGQTAHIAEPAGMYAEQQDAFFNVVLPDGVAQLVVPLDTPIDVSDSHELSTFDWPGIINASGLGGEKLLDAFAVRTTQTRLYLFTVSGVTE